MWLAWISFLLLLWIAALVVAFFHHRYSYWARRGVLHDKPQWFYGNTGDLGKTNTFREPLREFYKKYNGKAKFCGFYASFKKVAVIMDLDLAKQVLVKDFNNFANRGMYYNEKDDPLSAHVFNLDGPLWRETRNKVSPTFTALKMNEMLPMVVNIAECLAQHLHKEVATSQAVGAKETSIEVREWLARFTTDVIGSCAFGLDCNSLENPNAEFRTIGRQVNSKRRHGAMFRTFLEAFPNLCRFLRIKLLRDDITDFYTRVVRETIEYREKNKVQKNDFIKLMLDQSKEKGGELSFYQIAAQSYVFLVAGFESSSNTMSFALYLLATHPEIQQKARREVQEVLAKNDGQLNSEALKQLTYNKHIIHETLRLYSIAAMLTRKAINDYKVPDTDFVIEAGTQIFIPIDAIHHDPEVFPDPDRFNPDRFTPEEVQKRHPMAWLPFGAGSRNCIGLRFGEMQTVVGLATLLKNFNFSVAKETTIPLELDPTIFLCAPKGGITVNVQPI